MKSLSLLLFLALGCGIYLDTASAQATIPVSEFRTRRGNVMQRIPDGIILLHANSGWKHWEDSGFRQDANFFYFTGLKNLHRAILAIDGISRESWLFVSPFSPRERDRMVDLKDLDAAFVDTGQQSEQMLGLEHVVSWDGFIGYIDTRLKLNPKTVIYLDDAGQVGNFLGTTSNPAGLPPIENPYLLWANAIKTKWPQATVGQAYENIQSVRGIKSPGEIAELRRAASFTAEGFWAGVAAISPGVTQRQVEGEVIRGGMAAGADAPSFWPWVRSGPYAFNPKLFEAFLDYHHLNRRMLAGELVRINVGFDSEMYKGDFGRTLPVSGNFDSGQKETLDLLTGGYKAGLTVIRDGVSLREIIQTSIDYIQAHQTALKTSLARQAAGILMKPEAWSMYTHGIEVVDGIPKSLRAGNVLCDAPEFSVAGQGFYVGDMLLITKDGYELINPALPYAVKEIEQAMAERKHRRRQS